LSVFSVYPYAVGVWCISLRCVDKLSRLCTDVQSRHAESLQLNVNSPLYKKFAK